MIKYWPSQPSIKLNNAIVELFLVTERKLNYNLRNHTNHYLYIDILNTKNKYILFQTILNELKNLLLNLVEININQKQLNYLNHKIFLIFIRTTLTKIGLNKSNQYNHKVIKIKNSFLFKELITYLVFGSERMNIYTFSFDPIYTPYNHVQILFENFIIQVANIVLKHTIEELNNFSAINKFLKKDNKFNQIYTSNRSIILFLNNLKLQDIIELYIYTTQSLYNEREQIWIISSRGITSKYIYVSKIDKLKKLNQGQTILLLWLEIKDIIIPKIEKIIIQIGKYTIYFIVNLFSNFVILLIRIIIFYLIK
uniref:Uncharacterized protein n=1 Tax=Osmundea sinicola TaxID=290685 RepID=A0A7L4WP29_9FLOR|nr:hypothetical protein [Osmundea sinicola]QFR99807.1 hypothetical protein [Osmundea sinicola]